jgi:hypothetical protein
MNIAEFFALPDSPSAGSPVGSLIVRIVAKYPAMSFADARTEAKRLLGKAAGAKYYCTPRVLSAEEKKASRERFQEVNDKRRRAQNTPVLAVSGCTAATESVG